MSNSKSIVSRITRMISNILNIFASGHRVTNGPNKVRGSGQIKKVEVDTEYFNRVNNSSSADLLVVICDEWFIEITADENIVEVFDLSYFDDCLNISFKDGVSFNTKLPLKIKVGCRTLLSLECSSSGRTTVNNLAQHEFELTSSGSGNTLLKGSVDYLTLNLYGSGDTFTTKLKTPYLEVNASGSGDLQALAGKGAICRLSGSGDTEIYGKPAIKRGKNSGSGSLRFVK